MYDIQHIKGLGKPQIPIKICRPGRAPYSFPTNLYLPSRDITLRYFVYSVCYFDREKVSLNVYVDGI